MIIQNIITKDILADQIDNSFPNHAAAIVSWEGNVTSSQQDFYFSDVINTASRPSFLGVAEKGWIDEDINDYFGQSGSFLLVKKAGIYKIRMYVVVKQPTSNKTTDYLKVSVLSSFGNESEITFSTRVENDLTYRTGTLSDIWGLPQNVELSTKAQLFDGLNVSSPIDNINIKCYFYVELIADQSKIKPIT